MDPYTRKGIVMNTTSLPRLISVSEACKIMGIGRTKIYEEINCRRLDARKYGTRTLISEAAINDWMTSLPVFTAQGE